MPSSTLLAAAEAAHARRRRRKHWPPAESVTLHLSVFRSLQLPPRERDWAGLPPELISSILHRLRPVEIMLCADKVCRSWRHAARHEPELWRRIDMVGHAQLARRGLADLGKMAADAALYSQGQCEAFRTDGSCVDDDFLCFLADKAPLLKSLNLYSCRQVSHQGFVEAIKRFPLLEELELLSCFKVGTKEASEVAAMACPRLKHLRLDNKFCHEDFDPVSPVCECWTCLGYFIRGNKRRYPRPGVYCEETMIVATVRELRSRKLYHNDLTYQGLMAILAECPQLESHDIRKCRDILVENAARAKSPACRIVPESLQLTTKLLRSCGGCVCFEYYVLNPSCSGIKDCREITKNVGWRVSGNTLQKKIKNYHRETEIMVERLKCMQQSWKRRMDKQLTDNSEPNGPVECSTCLMLQYFAQRWDDLALDGYADPSSGLDSDDEINILVEDRMLCKKSRRYLI